MIAFHGASNGTSNGVSNVKKLTSVEAKAFIRSRQDINRIGNCMRNTRDRLLIDDRTLRQDDDFLLLIRSCFLNLRYDNDHVVKLYNPHRFSRQFGFCQNIPGALKPHSEEPSLQYLWSLFQTSTRLGTKSSFLIPASGMNNEIRTRTTAPFKLWWKTSYSSPGPSPSPPLISSSRKRKANNDNDTKADSSDKGKSKLQNKLREKQKNDQDEDDFDFVKELETMGNAFASNNLNAKELEHTSASIDPNILAVNENPTTSMEAPSFNARVMISEADHCAARFLAQQMRTKMLQTPLANIHELDSELKELFGYISSKNINVTSLQEHVGNYVEHA
ncbi:Protein MAINTENANCE OF MERISTEMS [Bienertia sinuspersici]